MRAATICVWQPGKDDPAGWHLTFHEDALGMVEAVVAARLRGFEELYWCDDNRAMMALFLASVRAVGAVEGGAQDLVDLVKSCRGDPDYTVLTRLDKIARQLTGIDWGLAQLFDAKNSARRRSYQSGRDYNRVKQLDPSERAIFDANLRAEFSRRTGTGDSPVSPLLDVPQRPLHLGGTVLIRTRDGKVTEARNRSAGIKASEERLRKLSEQITLYTPDSWLAIGEVAEETGTGESRMNWVSEAIHSALTRGSSSPRPTFR